MKKPDYSIFQDSLDRLSSVTQDCRFDMHEADEDGVYAVVSGYHLDNAMGENPNSNFGELTVGLHDGTLKSIEWFNLADLIALARLAKLP